MYLSDPTSRADNLDQFGQYELFWFDDDLLPPLGPALFPCGRLHSSPAYFTIDITWTDLLDPLPGPRSVLSLDSFTPQSYFHQPVDTAQLLLFKDIFVKREPLLPPSPTAIIYDWLTTTAPLLAYTCAHFRSSKFSIPETVYDKMSWYLVYGVGDIIQPVQFLDQIDYTALNYNLLDKDAYGLQAGQQFDQPNEYIGWTLLLVRQVFTVPDNQPNAPPVVSYHTYGAWTLPQPTTTDLLPFFQTTFDQISGEAYFDPTIKSKWFPYYNPLAFPAHFLTLSPWQP